MPLASWETLTRTERFKNPWWTYRLNTFQLPGGQLGEYHFVHTNGSSLVIPRLPDGRLVLVNQFRYLAERESVEFPCGSVKDGSTYEETARHELREETGYSAEKLTPVGSFNPYNGVTDEFCRIYFAEGLRQVGGVPDATEEFEIREWTLAEMDEHIVDGSLWDGMTIAAWCIAKARRMFE
ncbi:MAG: NUDIX hydrolase [Bacteroidota bacterium]